MIAQSVTTWRASVCMVCSKEALHQLVQSLPDFGRHSEHDSSASCHAAWQALKHAMLQESAQQD